MAPQPKPLPSPPDLGTQIALLMRPEQNPTRYLPLESAADHPFDPRPTTWSRVNAWWLAEASWLAYWHDAEAVKTIYRDRAGLSCTPMSLDGTQCYVIACDDFAIVAFRGTQADEWVDVFSDLRCAPTSWHGTTVHSGFGEALDRIWTELDGVLKQLSRGCRVWFTGHSLGGALATLAAYRYGKDTGGVYTFGSPLVGLEGFANALNGLLPNRSYRYVNDSDIVTHVPPEEFGLPGRYTHVERIRWIGKDGQVSGTTPPRLRSTTIARPASVLDFVKNLRGFHSPALPRFLRDHTPLYYVIRVWNDLADH